MDMDYQLVQKYLSGERPILPHPWHADDNREGTSTLGYVRMLLDALSGDSRRTELRRLLRLYRIHQRPNDQWKNATFFMLVSACYNFCDTMPYSLLERSLGPAKKEPTHGLLRTSVKAILADCGS